MASVIGIRGREKTERQQLMTKKSHRNLFQQDQKLNAFWNAEEERMAKVFTLRKKKSVTVWITRTKNFLTTIKKMLKGSYSNDITWVSITTIFFSKHFTHLIIDNFIQKERDISYFGYTLAHLYFHLGLFLPPKYLFPLRKSKELHYMVHGKHFFKTLFLSQSNLRRITQNSFPIFF